MPAARSLVDRLPPPSLVVTAAVSLQFGAAFAATLFDELGPAGASLLRLGFAAIVLLAVWRPDPRAYAPDELRLAVVYGISLGGMNLAFYEALDRLPLGIAVTVEFAGPLGVAVAASRRPGDFGWAALAAAGILLLADPGGGAVSAAGIAFALLAAALWAAYILATARAGKVFTGGRGLAMASAVAVLIPLGPRLVQGGADLLRPALLASGLAVALLSSVIPYSLEFEALRRMPARVFGVLMSLEPAIAALAGFVVLGEDLSARQLVAIGCVVVASVGVTRRAAPSAAPDELVGA